MDYRKIKRCNKHLLTVTTIKAVGLGEEMSRTSKGVSEERGTTKCMVSKKAGMSGHVGATKTSSSK